MLTSEIIREIGETIKLQLLNVKRVGNELQVALLSSPMIRLSWSPQQFYSLLIDYDEGLPSLSRIPQWINVSNSGDRLRLEFPVLRLAELEYLLRKTIESHMGNPESDARNTLFASLNDALRVWSATGEPMTQQEQIGLIGELNAIRSMLNQFDPEKLIQGWDETSRRQIDIVFDEIQIECKTVGQGGSFVESSSLDQFVTDRYPILLTITEVSTSTELQTLPEIVQSMLDEIGIMSTLNHSLSLTNKINSRYPLLLNHREYYHSKWQVGNFSLKIVNGDSTPASFPLTVPSDVQLNKFRFEFTELEDFEN